MQQSNNISFKHFKQYLLNLIYILWLFLFFNDIINKTIPYVTQLIPFMNYWRN